MALILPFLVADAILGWMVWHSWHAHEVLGTRLQRQGDDRSAFWLGFSRLAALLALSLVGTIAAWHAA
ncbi:hypothetical protein [Sphingomonas oligophenolica]|uniref:Uncharacterized protein n=1 Tax=Sphingomonas oligophenolica TaxID=301154 RepID=A0A502CPH0_9SPHN|nr:hypothetical protein [Sphingomonas oligophenolica]TPG15535.1 hypothetical protein EAH84_01675 [Sphingomonas oligophenolica]